MIKEKFFKKSGQSLISLIIYMVIAVIIISGAVAVIIINSKATTVLYRGAVSQNLAEAGMENALIRLLRNPSYSGETLAIGPDSVLIQVSGGGANPYVITSSGTTGSSKRTIQVEAEYNDNILTVTSWREL
jgi:hypothetical protein